VITGLLLRAFPSLLNAWGVDGNIAYVVFGAALLHALITAPSGLAGQLAEGGQQFGQLIRLRLAGVSKKPHD
jgi:branched-chain amino acid transport system permease protein